MTTHARENSPVLEELWISLFLKKKVSIVNIITSNLREREREREREEKEKED